MDPILALIIAVPTIGLPLVLASLVASFWAGGSNRGHERVMELSGL